MQTRYELILSAVDRGVRATFTRVRDGATRGQRALSGFNRTAAAGERVASGLARQLRGLVAAYVGFQGIRRAVDIMREAETAMFNLNSAVDAASQQFGDSAGNIDDWSDAIDRLSDRLRIYSRTELREAAAMTIEQTKHFGFAADQMEEIVARAAEITAGQVPLEQAINAVTSALRGQGQQAERMGIMVSNTYAQAWHDANSAQGEAWASLSEGERAMVRFQLMLEQTEGQLDSSRQYAETFSGSLRLIQSAITDAISENDAAVDSLNTLAEVLRDNADEIGEMAGSLVGMIGRVVEAVVEWRRFIGVLLGTMAAISIVKRLTAAVIALHKAVGMLAGSKALGVLAKIAVGLGAVKAAAIAIPAAAAAAVGGMIYFGVEAYKAGRQAEEAAERAREGWADLEERFKDFSDIQIPGDITRLAREDLQKLHEDLRKAQAYYRALQARLSERLGELDRDSENTWTIRAIQETEAELARVEGRLQDIGGALRDIDDIGDMPGVAAAKDEITATAEELERFRETAQAAYQHASAEAERYAAKVRDLNDGIEDRERSLQDRIRAMRRRDMDDEMAALDLRENAIEREREAREALARYRESGDDRELEQTRELAREADRLWDEYGRGGEEATSLAVRGLERVNEILDEADRQKIGVFEQLQADAEEAMTRIEAELERLTEAREANIDIELRKLEEAKREINDLVKDETKTITIRTVETRAAGGRVGMSRGGRFPGDSRIDSIPVLARPGEGFVRNEALRVWDRMFGTGFFEGINNPASAAGQAIIKALRGQVSIPAMPKARPSQAMAFADGGRVPGVAGLDMSRMGTVDLNLDGTRYPVAGDRDVLEELSRAIDRKKRRRPNRQ